MTTSTTTTTTNNTPKFSRPVLIHKQGEEGALIINGVTGLVDQPADERPAWAEGLVCAMIAEWTGFYAKRTGKSMQTGDILAFEDLTWLAINEDGAEVELEANGEFRMERVASLNGIDVSDIEAYDAGTKGEVMAEVELSMDAHRTAKEAAAFEHSQVQGFEPLTKTGTEG
jgi:hypothetical protein